MAGVLDTLNASQATAAAAGLPDSQGRRGSPVIVLAGPGTGKTRVIVHRIAHMVREREIDPARILAVTFTVKAAEVLRGRLAELIGFAAEDVQTFTFHGLGHRLLRRYGDVLGLPREPEMLDGAQTARLMREIIRSAGLFPESRGLGADAMLRDATAAIEAMKDRAIEPARAAEFARAWGERLDRGEVALAAGEDPREVIEAQRGDQRFLQDAAELASRFAKACADEGLLSFGDLIALPTRLMREHATMAAQIRQEFRHVIVDEFQDVNAAQIELLGQIVPPAEFERGEGNSARSLCVVGDDDQAIYAFRGADDRAFSTFAAMYPSCRTVRLTTNYRSTPKIIGVSNGVIARATDRFDPGKVIEPASNEADGLFATGSVECVKVSDAQAEPGVIAAMILADRERAKRAGGEHSWGRYAVIARGHGDLDRAAGALALEGIPCIRSRPEKLDQEQSVLDALAWARTLTNPSDAPSVLRLLARPPIGVPVAWASSWIAAWRSAASHAEAGSESVEKPGGLIAWLTAHLPAYVESSDPHAAALSRFLALHARLTALMPQLSASDMTDKIVREADLAHAELLDGRERATRVNALVTLLRFVRSKQARLEPPGDLAAFLAYYEDLDGRERERMELGADKLDLASREGEDAPDVEKSGDAVRLMTAHAAKGLEFDTVFVMRLNGPHGFPKTSGGDDAILPRALTDTMLPQRDARSLKERRLAEERRLFYVACTRAQRRLVVFSRVPKKAGDAVAFFAEVAAAPGAVVMEEEAVRTDAASVGISLTGWQDSQIEMGAGEGGLSGDSPRERLRRERRSVRLSAALALDQASKGDAEAVAQAEQALRGAARKLAIIEWIEQAAKPASTEPGTPDASLEALPQWARQDDDLVAYAEKVRILARSSPALKLRGLTPPLRLSYSHLDQYLRCPACYFAKFVLNVPEPTRSGTEIGTVAHEALSQFYSAWREAEAEGRASPGLDDLLARGRKIYFAKSAGRLADPVEVQRLHDLLTTAFERFHDPAANIQELEMPFRLPWTCNGITHVITGRIDRVDQRPDGSRRIVDYKSGQAWKKLVQPEKDDLQMGIYAMALEHLESAGDPARVPDGKGCNLSGGVAEYWMIATGEKGTIELSAMKLDKVRAKIDRVIEGLLAGRFTRSKDCSGLCAILPEDAVKSEGL